MSEHSSSAPAAEFKPYEFISDLFGKDTQTDDVWLHKIVDAFERHLNWTSSDAVEQLAMGPCRWWLLCYRDGDQSPMEHFVAKDAAQALACLMRNVDDRCLTPTGVARHEDGVAVWRGNEMLAWTIPFKPHLLGDDLQQRCVAVFRGLSLAQLSEAGGRLKKLPALQLLLEGAGGPALQVSAPSCYRDSAVVFEPGDAAQRYALFTRELGRELTVSQARDQLAALFRAKDWHQVMARWDALAVQQPYQIEEVASGQMMFANSITGALGCLELFARKQQPGWAHGNHLELDSFSRATGQLHLRLRKVNTPEDVVRPVDRAGDNGIPFERPSLLEAWPLEGRDEHGRMLEVARRITQLPCSAWPEAVAQELHVGASREEQLHARDYRRNATLTGIIGAIRFATYDQRSERRPVFVMESLDENGEPRSAVDVFVERYQNQESWNVPLPAYKTEGRYVRGSLFLLGDYNWHLDAFFEDIALADAQRICEAHELRFRVDDRIPYVKEERAHAAIASWMKRVGL